MDYVYNIHTTTQYKTGISAQAKFNIYEKRSTVAMGIYIDILKH